MKFVPYEDGSFDIYFNKVDREIINKKGIIQIDNSVSNLMADVMINTAVQIKKYHTTGDMKKDFIPRSEKDNEYDFLDKKTKMKTIKIGKKYFFVGVIDDWNRKTSRKKNTIPRSFLSNDITNRR